MPHSNDVAFVAGRQSQKSTADTDTAATSQQLHRTSWSSS